MTTPQPRTYKQGVADGVTASARIVATTANKLAAEGDEDGADLLTQVAAGLLDSLDRVMDRD